MFLRLLLGIAVALTFASCKSPNKTASTSGSGAYGGSGGADDFYHTGGNSSGGGEYDYVYDQGAGGYDNYSGDNSSYSYESDNSGGSYANTGSGYSSGGSSGGYSAPSAPSARYYTVQKGDTLYRISKNHGTSVAAIQDANNISGTLIRPGEQLVIP